MITLFKTGLIILAISFWIFLMVLMWGVIVMMIRSFTEPDEEPY